MNELDRFSAQYQQIRRFEDRGVWRGVGEIVAVGAMFGAFAFLGLGTAVVTLGALVGSEAARLLLGATALLALGVTAALTYYVWTLQCQVKVLMTLILQGQRQSP